MASEETFINRLRSALQDAPQRSAALPDAQRETPTPEQAQVLATVRDRSEGEYQHLIARLTEAAPALNLQVTVAPDTSAVATAIGRLIDTRTPEWGATKSIVAWHHPLVKALNLPQILDNTKVPIHFAPMGDAAQADPSPAQCTAFRDAANQALVGITSADFCLADTATLVIKTRPGQARSASLSPSIHVAVIARSQLLADLKELFTLLRFDPEQQREGLTNCLTFISGPSKTADIEATLVHGAHGPAEMHLFVIDS